MPAFCAFYAMTPTDYRALTLADFTAMGAFMRKTLERRK